VLGHPIKDHGDPTEIEAKGAAAFPPGQPFEAMLIEPLLPAVDGVAATEEEGLDLGPGPSLGQEQDDMGAEAQRRVGVSAVDSEQVIVQGY
jgi:hypothetical protein